MSSKDSMKEGAITLLDILGWKGIWKRKGDALDLYDNLINISKATISFYKQESPNKKNLSKKFGKLKTQVIGISDTIAFVTYGDCDLALQYHVLLSSLTIGVSLNSGIPVRGAICYGKLMVRKNTMIGPAVDEVASWYEQAEWVGVFQTPSALYSTDVRKYELPHELVVRYKVPLKEHGVFETNCINWPWHWKKSINEEKLMNIFLSLGPISPTISPKLENTLAFYKYCRPKKRTSRKK